MHQVTITISIIIWKIFINISTEIKISGIYEDMMQKNGNNTIVGI